MSNAAAIFSATETLTLSGATGSTALKAVLLKLNSDPDSAWFSLWRDHVQRYVDLALCDTALTDDLRLSPTSEPGRLLFAAQTVAAVAVDAMRKKVDLNRPVLPTLFDWLRLSHGETYNDLIGSFGAELDSFDAGRYTSAGAFSDLIGTTFQSFFPPALRHLLGEYYTPSWVISKAAGLIDLTKLTNAPTIFDPAGGSGGFLVHLSEYVLASVANKSLRLCHCDVSPIALVFAQLNLANFARSVEIDVTFDCHLADTILDEQASPVGSLFSFESPETFILGSRIALETFDVDIDHVFDKLEVGRSNSSELLSVLRQIAQDRFFGLKPLGADIICGNPPWISWDGLKDSYRRELTAQWNSSTLITNTGWRSKVAAGKQDVAMLFVYRAADRHAALGAQMVWALPISLFQSRHAGAGFRRYKASSGRSYALNEIVDLSKIEVFSDAANRSAIASFTVDAQTAYPIKFLSLKTQSSDEDGVQALLAQPLDQNDPLSPLAAFDATDDHLLGAIGKSDYKARGGVNTGGANGILWVDVVSSDKAPGFSIVRNTGKSRGAELPVHEALVEKSALSPLLLGRNIKAWSAVPTKQLLLLYDKAEPKKAMSESSVKRSMPKAFAFAEYFRTQLSDRREYHRWGAKGPFYEVYRIGPYTFSDIKVVWQHTGFRGRLNPAVLDDRDGPITIPDQKVIMLDFASIDEAHYVCAFLSSSQTSSILKKYLGIDASTHIMDYVNLRKYDVSSASHRKLSELSKAAHSRAAERVSTVSLEVEIDSICQRLHAS